MDDSIRDKKNATMPFPPSFTGCFARHVVRPPAVDDGLTRHVWTGESLHCVAEGLWMVWNEVPYCASIARRRWFTLSVFAKNVSNYYHICRTPRYTRRSTAHLRNHHVILFSVPSLYDAAMEYVDLLTGSCFSCWRKSRLSTELSMFTDLGHSWGENRNNYHPP